MIKKLTQGFLALTVVLATSCMNFEELNKNPNGVPLAEANQNHLMTNVLSRFGKLYLNKNYDGYASGIMQYMQKDAWHSDFNNYKFGSANFTDNYDILRDNKALYKLGVAHKSDFHRGVSLVMKSINFGFMASMYGDIPYSEALRADAIENVILNPKYDSQIAVLKGCIEDLQKADVIFASCDTEQLIPDADIYYQGDVTKWRKFANSLMLRFYLRLTASDKEKADAVAGINSLIAAGNLMSSNDDDCLMSYSGISNDDSWPTNIEFQSLTSFTRYKASATLVDLLKANNDARLEVFVDKVETKSELDPGHVHQHGDEVKQADGSFIRYMWPENVDPAKFSDEEYVGLPTQLINPELFNYNTEGGNNGVNRFCSLLNPMFSKASGPLLKARLMTYSETQFILAEAALKLGTTGNAQMYYDAAVNASLDYWGVSGSSYPVYDGTHEQIMEQKWIANFGNSAQSWFDYIRTGFPIMKTGPAGLSFDDKTQAVLPIRYAYGDDEAINNIKNYADAVSKLEPSGYSLIPNDIWDRTELYYGNTDVPWVTTTP